MRLKDQWELEGPDFIGTLKDVEIPGQVHDILLERGKIENPNISEGGCIPTDTSPILMHCYLYRHDHLIRIFLVIRLPPSASSICTR